MSYKRQHTVGQQQHKVFIVLVCSGCCGLYKLP